MGLFDNTRTRQALAVILMVVGAVIVLLPDNVFLLLGDSSYIWSGLTGVGFATAGWIALRIYRKVDVVLAILEGFLFASVFAIVVIVFNWSNLWAIPTAAAALIIIMAYRGRFGSS